MRPEAEQAIQAPPRMLPPRSAGTTATTMTPTCNRPKKKPPAFTGPRERLSQMLVRLRQLEGDPHFIAMGMGVGIFVSIMPIIPLQTLIAVALAYLFKGSKSAAALGTWLSNPLTIPLVYYANYKLGCLLLGYETTLESISFDSFSQLMALGIDVTWAMLVGGAVIGAILGVLAYFISFRIFTTLRHRSRPADPGSGSSA